MLLALPHLRCLPADVLSDEEDLPPWHWGPGLDLNSMDDDDVFVLSGGSSGQFEARDPTVGPPPGLAVSDPAHHDGTPAARTM